MTQMLLFDCPTTTAVPVVTASRETQGERQANPAASRSTVALSNGVSRAAASSTASPASRAPLSGSLPLHDPQQGELHRIGDLAQLVLARYELLHRRRAARRRACAAG